MSPSIYTVAHPDERHHGVFSSTNLGEVVRAIVAQGDRETFVVSANGGGFIRQLTDDEEQVLRDGLAATHRLEKLPTDDGPGGWHEYTLTRPLALVDAGS
jgi:hypothetical protein